MSEHDMENIFRRKLEDFEADHNDRWNQIEAALPKKKKRRAAFWLLGIGLFLAGSGITFFSLQNEDNPQQTLANRETAQPDKGTSSVGDHATEPTSPVRQNASASPDTDIITTPTENSTETRNTGNILNPTFSNANPDNSLSPVREHEAESELQEESSASIPEETPAKEDEAPLSEPENTENDPSGDTHDLQEGERLNSESDKKETKEEEIPPPTSNPTPDPSRVKKEKEDKEFPVLSIGIGVSAWYSYFTPKMPESVGNYAAIDRNMVSRNHALRQQIEKGGYAFNQSLWVNYRFSQYLSLSAGVSMMQTTQTLKFDFVKSGNDSIRSPGDFPEYTYLGPGGVYVYPNDSIIPGNTIRTQNKYFAREIPVHFNFHYPLTEKLELVSHIGASFRWVRSTSIYLPDIDNVGMVYLNGPEYYPGIRSTWQFQGGIGINYRLGNSYSLGIHPSVSVSLQSNVRFKHYVQQYQRQFGLQLRFVRKI